MNRSMEHQDRCGAAGLPLIVVDRQGREVPVPDGIDPADYVDNHLGPGYEALIRCIDHPGTPAVDCLICVPEED
jgi:hypothetical protein